MRPVDLASRKAARDETQIRLNLAPSYLWTAPPRVRRMEGGIRSLIPRGEVAAAHAWRGHRAADGLAVDVHATSPRRHC